MMTKPVKKNQYKKNSQWKSWLSKGLKILGIYIFGAVSTLVHQFFK
jgi:hypothetical protein